MQKDWSLPSVSFFHTAEKFKQGTNSTAFNIFYAKFTTGLKKKSRAAPELEISFTACRQGNLLACGVKYQLRDYRTFLNQDQRKRRP